MTDTHHAFQKGTIGQQAVDQFKIEVVAKYTTIENECLIHYKLFSLSAGCAVETKCCKKCNN